MKLSAGLALIWGLLLGVYRPAGAQVSLPSCQALSVCLTYRVNALQLNPGGYILYPDGSQGTTASGGGGGSPSGPAGGDLSGTYPNPSVGSLGAISGASLTNLTGANVVGNISGRAGSVASGGVDFSTITTALAGKLSTTGIAFAVASGGVDFSTITTALATKQATGNYITALTGNVTASGPGSVAATIVSVPQSAVNLSTITTALATKAGSGANTDITSLTGPITINGTITATSSSTAGAFFGDASNLTGFTVSADSTSSSSLSITATQISISTVSAPLRGSRTLEVRGQFHLSNSSGGSRTYTIQFYKNSVAIGNVYTESITNGNEVSLMLFAYDPSTSAGSQSYALGIHSSANNANQTIDSREISIREF